MVIRRWKKPTCWENPADGAIEIMDLPENVKITPDSAYAEKLLEVMQNNGGYCPCRLQRTPENICICQEFQAQIADEKFTGYCHCKLYYKEQ